MQSGASTSTRSPSPRPSDRHTPAARATRSRSPSYVIEPSSDSIATFSPSPTSSRYAAAFTIQDSISPRAAQKGQILYGSPENGVVFRIVNSVLVAEQQTAGVVVPAVDRAARLLRTLSAHQGEGPDQPGMSASELSRELEISKSTLSALLATLERHGLIQRDPLTRGVRLGLALVELAASVSTDIDVRETARPHLVRLRRHSGETAILHLVSGDDVRIAEHAEPDTQLKVVAPLRTRLP